MNIEEKRTALADISQLKEDFKNQLVFGKSFNELFNFFEGHNKSVDYFDFNYESLCATINLNNNKISLSDYFEVYDTNGCFIGTISEEVTK